MEKHVFTISDKLWMDSNGKKGEQTNNNVNERNEKLKEKINTDEMKAFECKSILAHFKYVEICQKLGADFWFEFPFRGMNNISLFSRICDPMRAQLLLCPLDSLHVEFSFQTGSFTVSAVSLCVIHFDCKCVSVCQEKWWSCYYSFGKNEAQRKGFHWMFQNVLKFRWLSGWFNP